MLRCVGRFVTVGALLGSAIAGAVDFTAADDLFFARGDGFEAATIARQAYSDLMPSIQTDEDRIYAVGQMSRLDMYRGAMVENSGKSVEERKAILQGCMDTTQIIRGTNSQQYHYFYLACMGFYGKLATVPERIAIADTMIKAVNPALDATRDGNNQLVGGFEAGGILRVVSAVRGNPKTSQLGLYNPEEAIDFAERALRTPKNIYRPFEESFRGSDYYENYYYRSQGMVARGVDTGDYNSVAEARKSLVTRKAELDGMIKKGSFSEREPEMRYYLGQFGVLIETIDRCGSGNRWQKCLEKSI